MSEYAQDMQTNRKQIGHLRSVVSLSVRWQLTQALSSGISPSKPPAWRAIVRERRYFRKRMKTSYGAYREPYTPWRPALYGIMPYGRS